MSACERSHESSQHRSAAFAADPVSCLQPDHLVPTKTIRRAVDISGSTASSAAVMLETNGEASQHLGVRVDTSGADRSARSAARPRRSVAQLLAAKKTRPIRSLNDLAADTFQSDEELEEFLAFTYAERHRDLA
jgi:hypothetical protein